MARAAIGRVLRISGGTQTPLRELDSAASVELGASVRDCVTGFNGIAIARIERLFGSGEIQVQPSRLDDAGKPIEPLWFDESRIECG